MKIVGKPGSGNSHIYSSRDSAKWLTHRSRQINAPVVSHIVVSCLTDKLANVLLQAQSADYNMEKWQDVMMKKTCVIMYYNYIQ